MEFQLHLSIMAIWAQTLSNLKSETVTNCFKCCGLFCSKPKLILVCRLLTMPAISLA